MDAPGKGKEEKMEDRRKYCKVCFQVFTSTDRRPRFIPCGHTFCTKCVSDNLQENSLLCPFCRKEHQSAASPTDFPIMYDLEDFLFEEASHESIPSEIRCPESDPPEPISKKLKFMRAELTTSAQSKKRSSEEVRSQLQSYQTFMKGWKESLHKSSETFSTISQQLKDKATTIGKESVRLSDAMQEEEEVRRRLEMAEKELLEAKTAEEVLPAIRDTTKYFDGLDCWIQEAQTNFPNEELIRKAQMMQEKAQAAISTLAAFEAMVKAAAEETSEESDTTNLPRDSEASSWPPEGNVSDHSDRVSKSLSESSAFNQMLTVEEKFQRALERASLHRHISPSGKVIQHKGVQSELEAQEGEFKGTILRLLLIMTISCVIFLLQVHSLKEKTPIIQMIESGKVFAEKEIEGKKLYAKISLQQNEFCLHVLSDDIPPYDATILQHDDIMSVVNLSSTRRAFLDLGTDEESLGKIIIKLKPNSKRAENFAALCMGLLGPSYVKTRIIEVEWKDDEGETVVFGDYEFNDGRGGKELIPRAGEEWEGEWKGPWLAGSVKGCYEGSTLASQFGIITKDDLNWPLYAVFGTVDTGLNIVQDVVSRFSNIKTIQIIDCGIILPL